jgi:hypothetical protein
MTTPDKNNQRSYFHQKYEKMTSQALPHWLRKGWKGGIATTLLTIEIEIEISLLTKAGPQEGIYK